VKTETILNKNLTGEYEGYILQKIIKTSWTEKDITEFQKVAIVNRLERIPKKISYFINRSKISKVWRTTGSKDPRDNRYYILVTDGTIFEAIY